MSWIDKILRRRIIHGDMTGGNFSGGITTPGDLVGRKNNSMGTVTINNQTFSGSSISISGGRVIIDGVDVTNQTGVEPNRFLVVKVEGDVGNVSTDKSVEVTGTVKGSIDAKGIVSCGDVEGDVKAGGAVNCDNVRGNVNAGGAVNCDNVGGSVTAGGSVNRG